ncbi:MAG: segregation and condensation protein [uncultured bacterium]|nr:MAG: segregation and condensation protein [uncultured bacterium]OGT55417.1 MAG: SMC-Scp complex subunit ScpB [Gammaproteobacteria bacterium RIFCSPHIGHO2_12_FULL_42_10]
MEINAPIIIEAALMVSDFPLTLAALQNLFPEDKRPSSAEIKAAIATLRETYVLRGIDLQEVASGYRIQAKAALSPWLSRLYQDKTPRYSRALLETLAIIIYKQPITRAEIEEIRGVAVSSQIIKTLFERDWIHLIGYREVPGRPALLGTTKALLDYFNVKSLAELPPLPALSTQSSLALALEGGLEGTGAEVEETAVEQS